MTLLLGACVSLGTFDSVDSDADGGISREEARRSEDLSVLFTSADDDQDGVLNAEEYELVRKVILQPRQSSAGSARSRPRSGDGHSH